jgi:hypothetical protein
LVQIFNRIDARFELSIANVPEFTIAGRIASKGRIEYHFLVLGGLTVQVKLDPGVVEQRLNAVAQVIAESGGMKIIEKDTACDYAEGRDFESCPIQKSSCLFRPSSAETASVPSLCHTIAISRIFYLGGI